MAHALIVDDDENTRESMAALVEAEGFTTACAADLRAAHIQLTRQQPDIVLIDLHLPDGDGLDLIDAIENRSETEIILITGNASVDTAIAALRAGAADYLVKPVNIARLRSILQRVPKASDLKSQIGALRSELRRVGYFGHMLGKSPIMSVLYDQISRVAPTAATVLLIGESGTGKELAAQTLHEMSRRPKQPFMAVNCGAISPNLIESEMFGHEKGSFTGADRQHRGYFERADGGTLFLDEITEMPIELQVKLLRVLETGKFMRIGTDKEVETDVRVIAATNRDPEAAVAAGKLRADLYHRLNVFPIQMPPLRERVGDVELLAQRFLDELNQAHDTHKTFPPEGLNKLAAHRWPGNVRELRNFVQRAYIMGEEVIDIGSALSLVAAPTETAAPAPETVIEIPVGMSLAAAEKQLILAAFAMYGGVKKYTAEQLGISLKTLYNRLEEYGLQGAGVEAGEITARAASSD
ncbi:sigma-54 dependent transcriptional regulator [uncultured Nevskia sp.]|uniref:sigma-54-dependent transcriptional regulator n=1 Tax=uncultured Nevskia sp. TaxID=228950 RepID=UPI0025F0AB6B|nr:sigma-54 dependent transcriptional regulator [uncultured Nevskia sp.]